MLHAVTVERFTIRRHDADTNRCDVLRGHGFRFRCRCGTVGRVRASRTAALLDGRDHVTHSVR
jgi:hypothetical protein